MGKILEIGEDSRLKGYAGRVTHAVLPLERTYCSNCGRPWGWASEESSEQIAAAEIIVFCEECFESLNNKCAPVSAGAIPCPPITVRCGERLSANEMNRLGLVEENIR
jgi:hypothetical protein